MAVLPGGAAAGYPLGQAGAGTKLDPPADCLKSRSEMRLDSTFRLIRACWIRVARRSLGEKPGLAHDQVALEMKQCWHAMQCTQC